jgi:hypothetical protein
LTNLTNWQQFVLQTGAVGLLCIGTAWILEKEFDFLKGELADARQERRDDGKANRDTVTKSTADLREGMHNIVLEVRGLAPQKQNVHRTQEQYDRRKSSPPPINGDDQ